MKTVLTKTLKNYIIRGKHKASDEQLAKMLIDLHEFKEELHEAIVELEDHFLSNEKFQKLYLYDRGKGIKRESFPTSEENIMIDIISLFE